MFSAEGIKKLKSQAMDYKFYSKERDEKGMYLFVAKYKLRINDDGAESKKEGSKFWRWNYGAGESRNTITLGKYPQVSLAEARDIRDQMIALRKKGTDPGKYKREMKVSNATENSFEFIAWDWFAKRGKKSEAGDARIKSILIKDILPYIGKRPLQEIKPQEFLQQVLRRIEARGAIETAHRAKSIAGQVFQFAVASGVAEQDITVNLKSALQTPTRSHFSAFTKPEQVGILMSAIKGYQKATPIVKAALELSAYLVCRPGELRRMEWAEVNWKEKRIELPAEKMKLKKPHIIPLCSQALNILHDLQRHTGNGKYIFPSARGDSRPMSENAVRVALRTLGFSNADHTAHGFRSTFRTIGHEVLGFDPEWMEAQLAHAEKNKVIAAYKRTQFLEQRKDMLQKYADYLDMLAQDATTRIIPSAFSPVTSLETGYVQ